MKRELDSKEEQLKPFPRSMAKYHYSNGECNNPYDNGSLDGLEYVDEYQQLMNLFDDREEF